MMSVKVLLEVLVFSAWLQGSAFGLTQSDKKYSKCKIGQHLKHIDKTGREKLVVCTEKIKGIPQWKFVDDSSTLGEIFNPARDCPDIVDQIPEAQDGFYWIVLPNGKKHKVWCDVHTDGGGFTLVGMKDSPVSWTVPSNATPVDPQGPPHWSSDLGDIKVLDFRVQISTDINFKGTKADWFYRLNPQREFGNLFALKGCSSLQAGIGNIEFVKDLVTQSVLVNNFKCSKFGPHTHHMLGWGKMNYCLRHQCKNGYAILDVFKFRYDNFGAYSYSAVSSLSGMDHNSTAFVGCDRGKCCACFGPKGGRQDYCGPKCTAFNGGTVTKKAFVWFWIRNRMPPVRLWKRCMEFVVKNSTGKLEKHFVDPEKDTVHEGSCSGTFESLLNEGTLTVSDQRSLEKIPNVPGLVSYRTDTKKIYFNDGTRWQALISEQEKFSECDIGQRLKHNDRTGRVKLLVCTEKIGGVPEWKFQDGSSTLGEIFNPAKDCPDIVDQIPEAEDGFYWIVLPNGKKHKAWCDVHTDGGGFTLVGMKDSPVSWTVPSNATPVDPQGPPHWSSDFGDVKVLDFRVQFSTEKGFKGTKANWFYRLNEQREFGNLFALNNGCPYIQAGIGNIKFVKDLVTQSVLKDFKCSKFGPHIHDMLGWGKMNYCLRHPCSNGYAILEGVNIKLDNFGAYSYSAVSSLSGMNHNSTAFVGCDQGKCCACFGPKGGRQNYCGSKCTAINGGTVTKKAFVWFWIRNRIPPVRLWKKCMELAVTNSTGKLERHFVDPEKGTVHEGSCSGTFKSLLNEGTLTVSDQRSFEKIPNVPGLVSYRTDNKKLYVNEGTRWQALISEQQLQRLNKQVQSQATKILNQSKEIAIQKSRIQTQEKKIQSQINIQENTTQSQEKEIQILGKTIQSQENKIQTQEKEINIQKNRTRSQEKKIRSQEKEITIQENRTLSHEKKIEILEKAIQSQENKIQTQGKEINTQKNRILGQEKKIQNQQEEIKIQENRTLSQEKNIQSQEDEIKIQKNRTQSQEKTIQSQENKIQTQGKEIKIQKNRTLNQEKKIEVLEKAIQSQQEEIKIKKNRTLSQEKKIEILEKTIQSQQKEINIQKNRTLSQEKKIRSQEEEIKTQDNRTLSQEKKIKILEKTIQSQQKEINIQKNRTLSQEEKIRSLQDTIKDVVNRIDQLHLPPPCDIFLNCI